MALDQWELRCRRRGLEVTLKDLDHRQLKGLDITSMGISFKWDKRALCGQLSESVSDSVSRVRVDV